MFNLQKTNLLLMIACALIPFSSVAQNALPGVSPFLGSIKLGLNPTHKAQCSIKSIEKKEGDFFGTRKNTSTTQEVNRSAGGELNYSMHLKGFDGMGPADYLGLTFPIDIDGAIGGEPVFKTNLNLAPNDLDFLKKSLNNMAGMSPLGWVLNKPLLYGATISAPDLCAPLGKIFNLDFKGSKRGGFKVVGVSLMSGRESIVIDGSTSSSCSLNALSIEMRQSGWMSFDRQSGLQNGGSTVTSMQSSGEKQINSQEDYVCTISGVRSESIISPPLPSGEKNSEQRLSELKSLFEKNLISKEQYDQKIAEILKAM